ncbi:MAG: hypothetical protein ACNS62_06400 [Candidatus Cyclobacteriaceae bacterium M3_2C_046]
MNNFRKTVKPLACLINLFILITFGLSALAQPIQKVKYKGKKWSLYSSPHLNIYLEKGATELSPDFISQMEEKFLSLSDRIGFYPDEKTDILIYDQPPKKYQPQNLRTYHHVEALASSSQLLQEISLGISHQIIYEMMGKPTYKKLPEWFLLGGAKYALEGNSEGADWDQIDVNQLYKLSGEPAMQAGFNYWNGLTNTYGQDHFHKLLNLARILRDEKRAFHQLTGDNLEVKSY